MQCSCVNCLFETILVDNLLQIVQSFFILGWKPILYWLFGPKNQSFQNKSGKTQPIRTKFGIHGYLKGWQRSGFWAQLVHFGQNGGWDESRRMQVFFLCGNRDDLSATSQWPIFNKFGHETYLGVPSMTPKDIFENFYFRGHLSPKSEIDNLSNRHLTQSRVQVTWCTAEIYCQGPGSFWGWSTFLYDVRLWSYGSSKLPNFRILAYFPHTKPLKRTLRWPAYSPGVTLQNDYDFFFW